MNTSKKPVRIEVQGSRIRYICPKCGKPILFRKRVLGRSLCLECGQALDWEKASDISAITLNARELDEAIWIAENYIAITGIKMEVPSFRGDEHELYLLFLEKKQYGAFMRKYAKGSGVYDG